jgi:betaine reductase
MKVVIKAATQVLAHVPSLVRYGSKPSREQPGDLDRSLRTFEQAVGYGPHQAYVGAVHPRELPARPWWNAPVGGGRFGPDGEIMPEEEFLGLLAAVDTAGLIALEKDVAERAASLLAAHPVAAKLKPQALSPNPSALCLPLFLGERKAGVFYAAHDQDESLSAGVLLENLCGKATASLALLHLLRNVEPQSIDYVLGCGEEAIGDRYQRGGGNMAKAVAEVAGLSEASGADVKDFCAAPVPALMMAGALVASGVFKRVAVVAGGSLAKLGMKFQGHLAKNLPVLEDVLGGAAALVEADDGTSPVLRLDAVGRHKVSAGSANPQIMDALAVEPLKRIGLKMTQVDDYATELHDPEVTETAGSGDVPARNYKTIAALAAQKGDIERGAINQFVAERGMPGFAPTQGHLASALCYLPWAVRRLTAGQAERCQLIAKGSLFLGRMCQLSDGMSVILERNRA